jgi:hypothetical protein
MYLPIHVSTGSVFRPLARYEHSERGFKKRIGPWPAN